MTRKARTLRLPTSQADDLALVAAAERVSENELIVKAVGEYLAAKRADQSFRSKLERFLDEDSELLEKLSKT